MTAARFRTVKVIIAAGVAASALHFADNAIQITHYSEPGWITPAGVVVTWVVVTAVAAVAFLRRRDDGVFFGCAGIYALILLSGLLHYAYGVPKEMPMLSNLTVVIEAVAGATLAIALITTLLTRSQHASRARSRGAGGYAEPSGRKMPTLLPGGGSVRLTNGTVEPLPPPKAFDADEAGFTIVYEMFNEDVMERRDAKTGNMLWRSFGPPYATVAPSRTAVLLPSGAVVNTDFPVSNVRAYRGNFFVTTQSWGRDIKSALAVRRNIACYGSDGVFKWHIGEPPGISPQYETVTVDKNGDAWALAGTQLFMARINLDTGDVFDLEGYK